MISSFLLKNVQGLFPQKSNSNSLQGPLDLAAIPPIVKNEALEIFGRLADNKAPGFDGVPNEAFQLAIKSGLNILLFEACLVDGFFPECFCVNLVRLLVNHLLRGLC